MRIGRYRSAKAFALHVAKAFARHVAKAVALPVAVAAVIAFGGFGTASRVVVAAPIACESLRQVPLTNGTLLSAESVPAGGLTLPPTETW